MSDNRSNGLETGELRNFFFVRCNPVNFIWNIEPQMRNILQLTLSIQAFKIVHKFILKFCILQDRPHYRICKNILTRLCRTHLFVSSCFCDPMRSNNLTNSGKFYNKSLTGELIQEPVCGELIQEPVCLSEHTFFSFSNLTSYLACNGNNSKANFRLENKVAFAQF